MRIPLRGGFGRVEEAKEEVPFEGGRWGVRKVFKW